MADPGSEAGQVVNLFLSRQPRLTLCVCDPLIYEYRDVFWRRLSARRAPGLLRALDLLLAEAGLVGLNLTYRPIARDPGDDHVAGCAINAAALLVTFNVRDFVPAVQEGRLVVKTPGQFLAYLREKGIL